MTLLGSHRWQVVEYEFLLKSNWQQRKTAKDKMAFTIHKYFTYFFTYIDPFYHHRN